MSDITVEFLRANPPHGIGERASFPRERAAALIRAGAARLPVDVVEPAPPASPALGSGPAIRTAALRRGTRKATGRP